MGTTTEAPEEIIDRLHRMDAEFAAAAKAGDARRLVEGYYAEDACVLPPHRDIVRGRDGIIRTWKGVIAAGLKDLALVTTQIDVCGEMAYGIGQFHMTVEPPGARPFEEAGKYLVVYRVQAGGEWKAVASMFSPNS